MRLLIVTRTVDVNDRYLGFFHNWITEFAKHVAQVTVICLKEGEHSLPQNVSVYSLGKEKGGSGKLLYAFRFVRLAWTLRHEYDSVFVHMNEEYFLLGGVLWRLLGKPAALWRNHYAGSVLTHIATSLARRVFYTSNHSYTARFKKSVRMPVGVETGIFKRGYGDHREQNTILSFGRLAPSKRIEVLLEAVERLSDKDTQIKVTVCGPTLPEDASYEKLLKDRALSLRKKGAVAFLPGIPHAQTPKLFTTYSIYVNCAPPGMLDKTIFEAAASGCLLLSTSTDAREIFGDDVYFTDASELTEALQRLIALTPEEVDKRRQDVMKRAHKHALDALIPQILAEIQALVADP